METKKCTCCGKELPIEEFAKTGFGVLTICKPCMVLKRAAGHKRNLVAKKLQEELSVARTARLSEFTPRELMEELSRRGYNGKLTYTEVHEIDIQNI